MCGACANENAIKLVFIAYRNKMFGKSGSSKEDFETAMLNKSPGCPKFSIMSFLGGFHGRSMGVLTCTHTKFIHKLDSPSFDWPIAEFPKYKYPLAENKKYNTKEDKKCLAIVEELFEKYKQKAPVAGLI